MSGAYVRGCGEHDATPIISDHFGEKCVVVLCLCDRWPSQCWHRLRNEGNKPPQLGNLTFHMLVR